MWNEDPKENVIQTDYTSISGKWNSTCHKLTFVYLLWFKHAVTTCRQSPCEVHYNAVVVNHWSDIRFSHNIQKGKHTCRGLCGLINPIYVEAHSLNNQWTMYVTLVFMKTLPVLNASRSNQMYLKHDSFPFCTTFSYLKYHWYYFWKA